MGSVGDAAITTTKTPLSPIRTSSTSTPRVGGYHYEKKNTSSSSTGVAPSPSTQQVTSQRRGSRQEAAQVIATIGKNHKSSFSIGAFLGGAPHSTLNGYIPPHSRQTTEPKSPPTSPSRRGTTNGIREQFSGSQGPRTSPKPVVVGSTNGSVGSITTTKLKALEAATSEQTGPLLRNSSSLRLKMPASLRKIGRTNSAQSNKQQQQQQQSELSTTSRLNALRPFSPFSVRPPVEDERAATSPSRSKFSLGAMSFEDSSPYRSRGVPESSPSFSTASSQEESLPHTPSTIRSGNFRPRSPVVPELSASQGSSCNLSFNEFLRDDDGGLAKIRIRPFPTLTQDDLSLVHHSLAEKHTADNRINRRASVSVTSMLSSTSSAHLNSYHTDDGGDHSRQQLPPPSSTITTTTTALGVPQTGRTDRPPLSPMTFERGPSPDIDSAELHGHDLPTPRLPPGVPQPPAASSSSSSIHPSEGEEEDGTSAPTPIATLNPEMPFNTFIIPSSHPTTTITRSNPHSRSVSRAGSSELGGGDSRNSLSDTVHSRSGGGGGNFSKKREKATPAQLALWEEDRERITRDMMEAYEGEACLIRFEPKQGWIGFWNRGDIDRVIDGLRDLRSPKS